MADRQRTRWIRTVCFGVLLLGPLAVLHAADQGSVPGWNASVVPWKLLFSSRDDLADTWGKLQIDVTPVRRVGECEPPGFSVASGFPLGDGMWEVFGQQLTEITPSPDPARRILSWKLVRATTRDGATYDHRQIVCEQTGTWTDHLAVAKHGDSGEYLALKLKVDDSGFAYTAFFSADGSTWQQHPGNPLFYDGDAMSLFWSPVLHRFVCINKSLQPYRKQILDHGGATPAPADDSLRDRRVLMMRTSADGRNWEPSVSMSDVWNRNSRKSSIPAEFLTKPDDDDPPDLEFYSGNGFWYHDRAYMMVLNYAASPLKRLQHGPHLDTEWWTSADGLRWQRPARGVNALDVFPQVPRLETAPLMVNGMILFPRGAMLLGLPEDRISGVGARANAEFSTRAFTMPDADLVVNAAIPSPDRPFANEQSYLMAAVLDESGSVVPGFEAEKCLLREQDRRDIPLQWAGVSAHTLAGRSIRLRFYLRSAHIYAVTAKRSS